MIRQTQRDVALHFRRALGQALTSNNVPVSANGFCFSYWSYFDIDPDVGGNWACPIVLYDESLYNGGGDMYRVLYQTSGGAGHYTDTRVVSSGGYRNTSCTIEPTVGRWFHTLANWSAATIELHVDGVLDDDATGSSFNFGSNIDFLSIGSDQHAAGNYTNGYMRDIAIYDFYADAEDIAALQVTLPQHYRPENMVWLLKGDSYTNVVDNERLDLHSANTARPRIKQSPPFPIRSDRYRLKNVFYSIPDASVAGGRIMSSLVAGGGLAGRGGIAGASGGLVG